MNTCIGFAMCLLGAQLSGEPAQSTGGDANTPSIAVDRVPSESVEIAKPPQEPGKLPPATLAAPEFRAPFADSEGSSVGLNDQESDLGANDKLIPVRLRGKHDSPEIVLRRALSLSSDDSLPSDTEPLALVDALASRRSGVAIFDVVDAYWALSTRLAAHRLAKSEWSRLEAVQARNDDDRPALVAARAVAALDEAEARLARIDAWHVLQSMQVMHSNAVSPSAGLVTQDVPHTGGYRTEYERLFPGATGVSEARRIHELLPARQEGIQAAARAIVALEALFDQKVAAYDRGRVDVDALLACHETLHGKRQAFLAAVKDYNVQIGRYVAMIAPGVVVESRIVRMLIKNPTATRSPIVRSPVVNNPVTQSPVTRNAKEPRRVSSAPAGRDNLRSVLKRRGVVPAVPHADDPSGVITAGAEAPADTSEQEEAPRDDFRPRK